MVTRLRWDCITDQSYCLVETMQPSIKDLSSLSGVSWLGNSPAGNSNRESFDLGVQKQVS